MLNDFLQLDFYESGKGETIVITFPDNEIAIVDAHPSGHASRDSITQIVHGKTIKFVCLTHPHQDHCADLVDVFRNFKVTEFWFPIPDLAALSYATTQTNSFPGPIQKYAEEFREENCTPFLELLEEVNKSFRSGNLRFVRICSERQSVTLSGVVINFLGPTEDKVDKFLQAALKSDINTSLSFPNFNDISAVLTLQFGGQTVILGADALKGCWKEAPAVFHRKNISPKACVAKVPHHGATNTFNFGSSRQTSSFLDVCKSKPELTSVLFAGDRSHPNLKVFSEIKSQSRLMCLSNGLKTPTTSNPLGIRTSTARHVGKVQPCNPVISVKIDSTGNVDWFRGRTCDFCS